MRTDRTALERAFELAKTGKFESVSDIKTTLASEGYSAGQVTGPTLLRQLRGIIKEAQGANAEIVR